MRKLILALFIASIAAVGFAGTASASTPHGSVNCAWAHSDPTCPTTQPGTPGGCTPASFAGGGCVTDTLSFTSTHRGHDGNWNDDRNRGPQDPCIIKFPVRHGQDESRNQDGHNWNRDGRGCRCETVKVWHDKIIWVHGCKTEIWYYTTESTCKHQRDPHPCTCQAGGHVTPGITRAA